MDLPHANRWDIVGRRGYWFSLSAALLMLGIGAWIHRGLNYGVDFTGGAMLRYQFERPAGTDRTSAVRIIEQVRDQLRTLGVDSSKVQVAEGQQIVIRVPLSQAQSDAEAARRQQEIQQALERQFGSQYGKVENLGRQLVGGVISKELGQWALLALGLGSAFILGWVSIRYEYRFAVAGVAAMLHDCFILIGVVALLQLEVDTTFVAALLTVLGFSVHDTIVIFDRIRENRRLHKRLPLDTVINASLWQTMARSINTVMTVMFTLLALYFLGGPAIHTFSLALIVGMTCGAYSSIFNAAQIVVAWHKATGGELAERERAVAASPEPQPSPVFAREPAPDLSSDEGWPADLEEAAPAAATTAATPSPPQAARAGPKPSKRKPGRERTRRRRW